MSELSPADIAARVVAWHNRHPLARRLSAADVHSVGHVALPFHGAGAPAEEEDAASGSLRERAMARSRGTAPASTAAASGELKAAFSEDFIPPLSPAEVAAFSATHGIERSQPPGGAPIRRVPSEPGTAGLVWRWVLTADLRAGAARTRVLLSPVPGGPVLGRRLWSLPRVGVLAGLGGAATALLLGLVLVPSLRSPRADLPAPQAASTPKVSPGSPSGAPALAASAAAPGAAAASRPLDVEPQLGRIELPPLGGLIDERRRQAAAATAAASAASAVTAATPAATPAAPPAPAPVAAAASAPVFALSTRVLRTRAESEQIAEALGALLIGPGSPVQRVEVMRAGDDFRVVAWPYPGRSEAERAQAAMQTRGHRLQLISF